MIYDNKTTARGEAVTMDTRHDSPNDDRPEDDQQEAEPSRSDYLWDASGTPDLEIVKLETLLGKFRHGHPQDLPAPIFPAIESAGSRKLFPWRMRLFPALAAAGVAIAAIIGAAILVKQQKPITPTAGGWNVSTVSGAPRIGRTTVRHNGKTNRLDVGEVLETDAQSRANLRAENVGQIEVDPSTRLRLVTMSSGLKRIALDHGTIHAFIWATPGQFVVDTPSAVTVDLGCAYALRVDDSGAGLVRTTLGWVGFKLNGRESFIPAGAACSTRPRIGPGTPYFEDAAAALRTALARFDFEDDSSQERAGDAAIVLRESRPRDAITVWHLLSRVDEGQRPAAYDRLKLLAPPPAGVTKEGILRLDQSMLDQWWNQLGFDDISLWRRWERTWSGPVAPANEK
jgi:hypothetical protein